VVARGSGVDLEPVSTGVVVVGAGPAGLAAAACLRRAGLEVVLLEKEQAVGASWRRHYDRLHLHTHRAQSALPHLPIPRHLPRYLSRDQVVAYLEDYARAFGLAPRLGEEVESLRRDGEGWRVTTARREYRAGAVVIATGNAAVPVRPSWPGLPAYRGELLHSADYRSGERFRGRRVLVVGFGNSGGEIAVDLAEHGARAAISSRRPVNVLPRELLGLPILTWAIALSRLPTRLADALGAPLVRLALGDLRALGLGRPDVGPLTQVRTRGRIPVIDAGTLAALRAGRLTLRPGLERFLEDGVRFAGGAEEPYDAVVLATGYRHGLERLLRGAGVLDAAGEPPRSGAEVAPGLYLCGFFLAPTGMLREVGLEARRIAAAVAARAAAAAPTASAAPPGR
jgi:cation diffusion facilitator CzcD-associated flavoprotein CzcO